MLVARCTSYHDFVAWKNRGWYLWRYFCSGMPLLSSFFFGSAAGLQQPQAGLDTTLPARLVRCLGALIRKKSTNNSILRRVYKSQTYWTMDIQFFITFLTLLLLNFYQDFFFPLQKQWQWIVQPALNPRNIIPQHQ